MSEGFHHISYRRHKDSFKFEIAPPVSHFEKWFLKDNADFWRHRRKHEFIEPLISSSTPNKWLCVGDGRYGTSAMYLKWKGQQAMASDIADELLTLSHEAGYIDEFDIQNAEQLTYQDESFDFVLCKESFHHFPRPLIALYEMLRVSKGAVVLIEPRDSKNGTLSMRMIRSGKNLLKKMLGRTIHHPEKYSYEPVGNFIYTLSEREVEKVALGMNLPAVAFCRFDDVYLPGVESIPASMEHPMFRKMQRELKRLSLLNLLGLHPRNYLISILFKRVPEKEVLDGLRKNGFRITFLPRNPVVE